MPTIALEHVSKHWGATRAVDDVSFTVASGGLVVLLGPSGCGKSTTLRLIAGLERVTAGRILVADRDVTDLGPARRHVSMVFQSYALFPHLSVAENIVFGLKVRRVPRAERQARLGRVADLLGLGPLLQRKPAQLSGGQQQRVALARAIVAETPVCLMDEPLSNLDAQLRQEVRREIRALQRKLGVTMVYVTHDQAEAMSMADRVILMREGRIEQDAPPAEMYARPATTAVARFIGTPPMNLLPLAPGSRGTVVAGTDGPVVLPAPIEGLLLGLRPEDLRFGPRGLAAHVLSVEYLGADSIVVCAAGDSGYAEASAATTFAVRQPGSAPLAPGAAVRVAWAPEAMHVFEAASGRRRDDLLAEARRTATPA